MADMLIQNARVIDPSRQLDCVADVWIKQGRIEAIGKPDVQPEQVLDAAGLVLCPGLMDMHVHLRDPGLEYKEDILTGCEAAAAGGVTKVACMPNTSPTTDCAEVVREILRRAQSAKAKVYPVASITKGLDGEFLTDYASVRQAGAVAVSDDGRPVKNARIMQEALVRAMENDLLVISHCEDMDIIGKGIINKGEISRQLGVEGMDRTSEDSITAREIALAAATGTRIHIAHVSTRGSVALIRDAKRRGVRVTAETCPHYFTLTDAELLKKDANYRMNPPLRTEDDRLAIIEGLQDGTLDAIVTDHAPHAPYEKQDFLKAPNGILGLQTSLALSLTGLFHGGKLPLQRVVELMSTNPCKILGIPGGTLEQGAAADITLFDPDEEWTFNKDMIRSKSLNTPFIGSTFRGRVRYTIKDGEIVYTCR